MVAVLCWVYFAPVTSRVSPRRASYFFLLRQKKVTKKKASHVRAASRSLALLAAFGTLANSLRSNSASVLIRTLLRCSARPNGGGIPLGSSASRTSPEGLVRFAHFAGLGCLIPHASLLSRARHAVPLHQTPSLLTPTTSPPLRPHSSLLRPPSSSPLTPQGNHKGSPLTPTPLTPHSSPLTPHPTPVIPGLTRNLSPPANAPRRGTACRARALPERNRGTRELWVAHRARHAVPLPCSLETVGRLKLFTLFLRCSNRV